SGLPGHLPGGEYGAGQQAHADTAVQRSPRADPDRGGSVGGQDGEVQAGALSRASRSADLIQDHHSDAKVMTAAASTTASGTLQGRSEAALIRRATDSPSTIRTKIWNRSARCQVFSGT